MRAVMPVIPPFVRAWRQRTGEDRWDEMWDGVLHMAPSPNRFHQDLEAEMLVWLRTHWAKPRGNKVYPQINVASIGGWPNKNYRIPDLVLLTPDRFHIDRNEYFEGPPTVVVEIHSPGDESYEKLLFYAELGVPEVWIINRDSREPEVFALSAPGREIGYTSTPANPKGWLASRATGILLRSGPANKLVMQIEGNDSTRRELPDE